MNEISRLFWMTMTSHASDILNMNGIPDIPCSIHTGGLMGEIRIEVQTVKIV